MLNRKLALMDLCAMCSTVAKLPWAVSPAKVPGIFPHEGMNERLDSRRTIEKIMTDNKRSELRVIRQLGVLAVPSLVLQLSVTLCGVRCLFLPLGLA